MGANPKHAGMISGFGKHHTNKNGDHPYLRLWLDDIRKLVDGPASVPKDRAQWLIPSAYESRVHAEQVKNGEFWLLWADVDWKTIAPRPMKEVASFVESIIGADIEIYASKTATQDRQKCRVLVPLGQPLWGGDWVIYQRVLNSMLLESGIEPDHSSDGAGQLLYLPNRGEWYDTITRREGVHFDPLSWSERINALRQQDADAAAAVQAARDAAKKRREALRATNVGEDAKSLIHAFKQAYRVEDILLQAGYDQRGNTFRHPNSETGSFSASVKDGRVHSLSSADPLYTGGGGVGAPDAFDAFQKIFHQDVRNDAIKDAGDNWLMIGAESWNKVQRRKYAEDRRAERERDSYSGDDDKSEPRQEFEYDLSGVPHVEYGIDGFTSIGVTVFAGEAGLGKTSTIVPLAATIAHLVGSPDALFSLNPVLRRKVVYVTEDAGQVQRQLYGLRHHRSEASNEEFREWFRVIEAHRKSPAELAGDIKQWRERFSYKAGAELNHYVIEPLIIIDTSNANIDLENENDNAEVGRAIAGIKQALEGKGMAWVVAHLAKGVSREEVAKLTVRGAGAWVGDVNATAFLISDPNLDGKRFLILGKKRFEPEYTEMEVASEVHSYVAVAPWGQRQSLRYMVCDLKQLTRQDSRAVQSAKAQTEAYSTDIADLLNREYEAIQKEGADWVGMTGSRIEKGVGGKTANVRQCLSEMVKAGTLKARTEGHHATAPTFYWLPNQNRVDYSPPRKGRSRDEATQKTTPEDEPLSVAEIEEGASSPYREGTKDEGGVLNDTRPPACDSSKSGRSKDEAGTKGTKLRGKKEKTPTPMAKKDQRQQHRSRGAA